MAVSEDVVESMRAKFEAVLPHLDERGQRLVLAGEARSLGHGDGARVERSECLAEEDEGNDREAIRPVRVPIATALILNMKPY